MGHPLAMLRLDPTLKRRPPEGADDSKGLGQSGISQYHAVRFTKELVLTPGLVFGLSPNKVGAILPGQTLTARQWSQR